MKKNWPYSLDHLIAYVENRLSVEEDIAMAKAIQEDDLLRQVVEGLEQYLVSESDLSVEAFFQQSNEAVYQKILFYQKNKKTALSAGEKSFQAWLKEQKLAILLFFAALVYLFGFWMVENAKTWAYFFQTISLALLFIFFLSKKSPEILPSSQHLRALFGLRQIRKILIKLNFSWILLYLGLFIFSFSNWSALGFISDAALFNFFNNITIVYLFLCYFSLSKNSIRSFSEEDLKREGLKRTLRLAIGSPIQEKEYLGWAIVLILFIAEIGLTVSNNGLPENLIKDIHLAFGIFSGLLCMVFTARLVGRIDSKFISKEDLSISMLAFYAGIQPLLVFIFPADTLTLFASTFLETAFSLLLVSYALFGKVLLFLYFEWMNHSNRLLRYLEEAKALDDYDDEAALIRLKETLEMKTENKSDF